MPRRKYTRRRKRRVRRRRRSGPPRPTMERIAFVGGDDLNPTAKDTVAVATYLEGLQPGAPDLSHKRAVIGASGMAEVSVLMKAGSSFEFTAGIITPLQGSNERQISVGTLKNWDPFDVSSSIQRGASKGFNIVRTRRLAFALPQGASDQVIVKNFRMTRRFRRIVEPGGLVQLGFWYRASDTGCKCRIDYNATVRWKAWE